MNRAQQVDFVQSICRFTIECECECAVGIQKVLYAFDISSYHPITVNFVLNIRNAPKSLLFLLFFVQHLSKCYNTVAMHCVHMGEYLNVCCFDFVQTKPTSCDGNFKQKKTPIPIHIHAHIHKLI